MGKQYNKLIKRRRRSAYLARRKAALLTEKASERKVPSLLQTKPWFQKSWHEGNFKTSSKKVKEEVAEKVVFQRMF